MSQVFVTNHSGFSYKNAEKFGEINYLTKGFVDLRHDYKGIVDKLKNIIETTKPEDYLLLSGNNTLCVIASNLWMDKHNQCNLLFWDNDSKEYITFDL